MAREIGKKRQGKIDKLAYDMVDGWDLDSLIEYARNHMVESLSCLSKEEFDEEWSSYYDVKEDKR